jgi:flagellar protein FlbT
VLTALKPTSILINNQVSMLLERQIMRPEAVTTPARQIYFAIQCAYMAEPREKPRFLVNADTAISQFAEASPTPEAQELLSQIRRHVASSAYYDALKLCNTLIDYEERLLHPRPSDHESVAAG